MQNLNASAVTSWLIAPVPALIRRAAVGLFVLLEACSSPMSSFCTPGQTQVCLGPGRCDGAQACLSDGSGYSACDCGSASLPDGGFEADAGSDAGVQDAGVDGGVDAGPSVPLPDGGLRCDRDSDGDGRSNRLDNCAFEPNIDQQDTDGDGVGDPCDNCLAASNPDERDTDGDGLQIPATRRSTIRAAAPTATATTSPTRSTTALQQ